jgi:hypothetical protein
MNIEEKRDSGPVLGSSVGIGWQKNKLKKSGDPVPDLLIDLRDL